MAILAVLGSSASAQQRKPIDLPWIGQRTPHECGRAVLASLGARYRRDVEQTYEYIDKMNPEDSGFSVAHLFKQAENLRLSLAPAHLQVFDSKKHCQPTPLVNRHFDQLANYIRTDKPVIVIIAPERMSHFVILTDYRDGNFEVHDPLVEEKRYFSRAELAEQMCSAGFLGWVVTHQPASRFQLPEKQKNSAGLSEIVRQ